MSKQTTSNMFTITTGMSTNRNGTTILQLFYYDRQQGKVVLNDLHRAMTLQGRATDTVKRTLQASTANSDAAGGLGEWKTRDISLPENTPLVLRYAVRAGSLYKEEVYLPLIISSTSPFCEARFPVITDARSSLGYLEFQGRFYVPPRDEFTSLFGRDVNQPVISSAIDSMDAVAEHDDEGNLQWAFPSHTKDVLRASAGTGEEIDWLALSTPITSLTATLRQIAAGERDTSKVRVAKKTVGSATTGRQKNIVISKKRRKISL